MESPKLATDNRFKKQIKSYLWNRTMLNFCGIVVAIWKWIPVEIFRCRESIQNTEIGQCWICAVLWWPFWKWWPVEIFQCQESIWDICPHMKWCWNRTMLNLCGNVVAILKMVTGRNFSMSGINSGHHYLPTYQILMISDNVEILMVTYHYVKFMSLSLYI